jgi:hypothetical protein
LTGKLRPKSARSGRKAPIRAFENGKNPRENLIPAQTVLASAQNSTGC